MTSDVSGAQSPSPAARGGSAPSRHDGSHRPKKKREGPAAAAATRRGCSNRNRRINELPGIRKKKTKSTTPPLRSLGHRRGEGGGSGMPRYAQLVMGPAGSGKSTYCSTMIQHAEAINRSVQVVNLDPAAEHFNYPVMADIRELIQVDDVMEDDSLRFGPNGGLVFCMEYFANNLDWLEENLGHVEDDYILFDCPGQIELYTHLPVMRQLVEQLQQWEFRVCGVFLVDSQFMVETFKFISGVMAALSAMVSLEIPQVNIMTKMDLLSPKSKKEIEKYLDPDMYSVMEDNSGTIRSKKFNKLTKAICELIDDYSMVRFLPFDRTDEEGVNIVLQHIDFSIQYGEDLEFKEPKELDEDPANPQYDEFFQDKVES